MTEKTAAVPEARRSGAARSFRSGCGFIQDFGLFLFSSSSCDNVMCLGNLLVLLISSSDIWNKHTLYNYAHFRLVNQRGWSNSIISHFSPCHCHSTKCMLFGLNLLKASCQVSDSFTHQRVSRSGSCFFQAATCTEAPLNHSEKTVAPTFTRPVRCSSTPSIGSCRRWLFLRLSRARLTPENTPRGRLRSRLAFRNNSWRDGMESKVPGSTSRISLYSK